MSRFLRTYAAGTALVCLIGTAWLFGFWRERGGPLWPVVVLWLWGSFSLATMMAPVLWHPERWGRVEDDVR